jgi:chromosome segregation ATPase
MLRRTHAGRDITRILSVMPKQRADSKGLERPLPIEFHIAGGQMYMNENEFQTKLAELMGEISTLPPSERQKLEKLADETRARHERLRQTVGSLQESLDYLRLSIKYLVFDLEATRRENGYLRKMLEETTGGAD